MQNFNKTLFECHQIKKEGVNENQVNPETSTPIRNGGSYWMSYVEIKDFIDDRNDQELIPEVAAFKKAIQSDYSLDQLFQGSIKKIPEGGVLKSSSLEDFCRMISITCTEPPKYKNSNFVGLSFATLFIDLMNNHEGHQFLTCPTVNHHLKQILKAYKIMLDSPLSLEYLNCEEPNVWLCPTASKKTNWDDFYVDKSHPHWGFKSFNDFFSRPIRPEARLIDPRSDSIVHSSDSSPLYFGSQSTGSNPFFNVQAQCTFWLKDNNYSLYDMFGARQKNLCDLVDNHFVGGTIYQAHLYTYCYHRWHAPVSGTVIKCYKIGDQYFMMNPKLKFGGKHEGIQNYTKSIPLLSMVSVRQIIIIRIDDNSDRLVAVIQIGMIEVSSCHPTVEEGQYVTNSDQLGYFQYGGSSYALVFDKKLELEFNPNIYEANENGQVSIKKVNSHLATFK